ncbi:MAG: helix-turn-helix transcriptional regulator [Bacteroidota bacterium]
MQNVKNPTFLKALGQRIKRLREDRKLTQLALGELCNNHAEQIGRIERGELNVSICSLLIIADALEIDLKELFDFN